MFFQHVNQSSHQPYEAIILLGLIWPIYRGWESRKYLAQCYTITEQSQADASC